MANYYRLDPAAQREENFHRMMSYLRDTVYPYHPAFRDAVKKAGISFENIRTYEDFTKLPLTTKNDYRSAPLKYVLQPVFPGRQPMFETTPIKKSKLLKYAFQAIFNRPRVQTGLLRKETLKERIRQRGLREWFPIHTHASSGSTGEPTPSVYTYHDFTHVLPELAATALVRPDVPDPSMPSVQYDFRRMNVFPGAPHLAFFQTVFLKTMLGMNIFDTFGGKVIPTDRQIEIFANGNFNSLGSIPSYSVYWLRRAVEMMEAGKIKPFGNAFCTIALGGEPVSPSLKAHLHDLCSKLGAHPKLQIIETYGSTEAKWAGFECQENAGIHLNPRFYFWELLHPETKQPVKPGEPGVLVFTHVDWRGTVFVRYWTGDLIQGGHYHEKCPKCGYTFFRMYGPIARADKDFTKVKGVQVALQQLVTVARDTPGVRNCQIILEKEDNRDMLGRDIVTVRVVPDKTTPRNEIENSLKQRIQYATELTPDRIIFEEDAEKFEAELFAKNGIKAEYLVERRAQW